MGSPGSGLLQTGSFPFLIFGKESLSRLQMSGSQGHEAGDASVLSVLQKQKKMGRNMKMLYTGYFHIYC